MSCAHRARPHRTDGAGRAVPPAALAKKENRDEQSLFFRCSGKIIFTGAVGFGKTAAHFASRSWMKIHRDGEQKKSPRIHILCGFPQFYQQIFHHYR
jgi:hypothetical protein